MCNTCFVVVSLRFATGFDHARHDVIDYGLPLILRESYESRTEALATFLTSRAAWPVRTQVLPWRTVHAAGGIASSSNTDGQPTGCLPLEITYVTVMNAHLNT